MAWIDTLRAAVMGTPPAAGHKPSREGVVRAAEELNLTVGDLSKQISMTASGVQSYATVANLPTPVPPNGSMARVYADPVATNNTFWLVKGGIWVKDAAFADAVAAVVQPLVDEAVAAGGFATLAAATAFAPKLATGEQVVVRASDTGTHAAVSGEIALGGAAATPGAEIPNEGVYAKQASGALWRILDTDGQTALRRKIRLEDTSFATPTRNLFSGEYQNYLVSGSYPGVGQLYNNAPNARTAIVQIETGKTYTVKVHGTGSSFRIAEHTSIPTFGPGVTVMNLTKLIVYNDVLRQFTFTATVTGFAFVTVSNTGLTPHLQFEEGSVATDYVEPFVVGKAFLPEDVAAAPDVLDDFIARSSQKSRNLFPGDFRNYTPSGVIGVSATVFSGDGLRRAAYAPIESGKTYTIKVHGVGNAFRVGVNTTLPPILENAVNLPISALLHFNDIDTELTFTAALTGYVIVGVSTTGLTPDVQIEEGAVATDYVPHIVVKQDFVDKAVSKNATVQDNAEKCSCALERLDQSLLFPTATDAEMTGADPGPRFVDYFDGKMWGYTYLNGDISYSEDDGATWTVHTNIASTIGMAAHRILPTSDGEVLIMTSSGVHKSSGWAGGTPTWSASKVTITSGATLFQFAFDGDGTKFILAEYGASTANWANSRKAWISTDEGDSFAEVWDSLAQHGAATNAETHLHGVAYDRFSGRFYLSEGHGPKGGLYCSADDGVTWIRADGYHDGVLSSPNVWAKPGDTNGPTVIVATHTGLVMGSDNRNNGVFGLVRRDDPLDEDVRWIYKEPVNGATGVAMFAIRGWLDEESGTAYIAFRSERNDQPPIICAGNPTEAALVYRHPTLPVVGQSDHFGAIAKTDSGRLVAYAQFGGSPYTFSADLTYPASSIQAIIRSELKKLGLVE